MTKLNTPDKSVPREPGQYSIHCKQTGQYYVGSTTDLKRRRRRHARDLLMKRHDNYKMQSLYDYYPDSFVFTYTQTKTKDEALEMEQQFLNRNHTNPKLLNIAMDARASAKGHKDTPEQNAARIARMLGRKVSEETKDKIRQTLMGRTLSEEHAMKARIARLNHTNSKEHNDRIRDSLSGVPKSKEHVDALREARPNPIIVDGVEYFNSSRASEILGIGKDTISRRLNNPNFLNYQWKLSEKDRLTGDEARADFLKSCNLGRKQTIEHVMKRAMSMMGETKTEEAKQAMRQARPNPVIYNGIEYFNPAQLAQHLNTDRSTILKRIKNPNYPNYLYKE